MLTPNKKVVRKELKQDTLLQTYVKTTGLYYRYRKAVNIGLTALLAAAVAFVIYTNNRRTNNEKAATELSRIITVLDAGPADPTVLRAALDGRPEQGMLGLRGIVENYGGTDAGELARYYLAGAHYRLGEWQAALEHYTAFSPSGPMLEAGARAGAAACHEALGEFADAAELYTDAAAADPKGIAAPEHLESAARCYGAMGRKEDARRILERLKDEYPASQAARDADRAIARYSI